MVFININEFIIELRENPPELARINEIRIKNKNVNKNEKIIIQMIYFQQIHFDRDYSTWRFYDETKQKSG